MVRDWHPRSTTRPRAANATNSRRSLARRSMHPHPHHRPRPHLAPAYDSLFFLTPCRFSVSPSTLPFRSTRLLPRALHFYLVLNFRSWPISVMLKHRSLISVFRFFLREIVRIRKIRYNNVVSHDIFIKKFPFFLSPQNYLYRHSAHNQLLTYARIISFLNSDFSSQSVTMIYLLFDRLTLIEYKTRKQPP